MTEGQPLLGRLPGHRPGGGPVMRMEMLCVKTNHLSVMTGTSIGREGMPVLQLAEDCDN
jgi:hypothetical protein